MLVDGGKMLLPILLAVFASWTPTGARVIHKRAAFYIANETMCIVDGEVFHNGDPVPTDDECERCTCRPPGFSCVLRDCDTKPGCKAVRRAGECCPDYVCGCVHNNRVYEDGEIIKDLQNTCYTCRCHGSSISCTFAECLFRMDCPPEYVQGECCPRYDHCPPLSTSAAPSTVFTPESSTHPPIIQQQEEQFFNLTTQYLEKLTDPDITVTVEDILHSGTSSLTTVSYGTSTLPTVTVKFTLTNGPISGLSEFDITTLSSVLPLQTATYTETTRYGIPDEVHGGLTTTPASSTFDYNTSSTSSEEISTHSSPNDDLSSSPSREESSTNEYYEQSLGYTDVPIEISKNDDDASTISSESYSFESSTLDYHIPTSYIKVASSESSTVDYNAYSNSTENDSPKISTIDHDISSTSSESTSSEKSHVTNGIYSTSTEISFTESSKNDYYATHSSESPSSDGSTHYYDEKYSNETTSTEVSTIDHDASHSSESSASESSSIDYDAFSTETTSTSSEFPNINNETSAPSTSPETSSVGYDAFFTSTESASSENFSTVDDTSLPTTANASSINFTVDNDRTFSSSESRATTTDYSSTSITIPQEYSSYIETHAAFQTDESFDFHDLNEEKKVTQSSNVFVNVASETLESEVTGQDDFQELAETSTLSYDTEINSSTAGENLKLFTDIHNQGTDLIESQSTENANSSQLTFTTNTIIEEETNTAKYSSSPAISIQNETFSTNKPSKEPATELYFTVKPFHSTKSTEISKPEGTIQPQESTEAISIDDEIVTSISDNVIKFESLPDSISNSSGTDDKLFTNYTDESFDNIGYNKGHSTFEISEETLNVDQSNEVTHTTNLTNYTTKSSNGNTLQYTTQTTYNTSDPQIFVEYFTPTGTTEINPDVTTDSIDIDTVSGVPLQTNDFMTQEKHSVVGGDIEKIEDFDSELTQDIIKYNTSFPSNESITKHSSIEDTSENISPGNSAELASDNLKPESITELPSDGFSSESITEPSATENYTAITTAEMESEINSDVSIQVNDSITKKEDNEIIEEKVTNENFYSKSTYEIISHTTSLPNKEELTEHSRIYDASDSFNFESTTELSNLVSVVGLSFENNDSVLTSTVVEISGKNETTPAYPEITSTETIQDYKLPHLINENELNEHTTMSNDSSIEKHTNILSVFEDSTSNQFEEILETSGNNNASFPDKVTTTSTKPNIISNELNSDDSIFDTTGFNEETTFNAFSEQDFNENTTKPEEGMKTQDILSELHNEVTTFSRTEYPNTFKTTVIPQDNINTTILSNADDHEIQQELSVSTQDSLIYSESDLITKDSLQYFNISEEPTYLHENLTSILNNLTEILPTETLDGKAENSTSEQFSETLYHTTLKQIEDSQNTEQLQSKSGGTTVNEDLNEKTEIVIVTLHPLKTDLSGLLTGNNKQLSTGESQNKDETYKDNYNDLTKVTEPFYGNQTESVSISTVETSTSDISDMNTHLIYTNEKEKVSNASNTSESIISIEGIPKDKIVNYTIVEEVIDSTVEKADSPAINILSGSVMTPPGIPGEGLYTKNAQFQDHKLIESTTILNNPVTNTNEYTSIETDQNVINNSMEYDIADAEDLTTSEESIRDENNSTPGDNLSTMPTDADDDTLNVSNKIHLQNEDINSEVNLPFDKNVSDYEVTLTDKESISDLKFTQVDETVKNVGLNSQTIDRDNLFTEAPNETHLNIDDYSVLDAEEDVINETLVSEEVNKSTEKYFNSLEESNVTSQESSETLIKNTSPEISEVFTKLENDSLTEIIDTQSSSSLDEIHWSDVTEANVPSTSVIPHYAEEIPTNAEIHAAETVKATTLESDSTHISQTTYIPEKQDNHELASETQDYDIAVSNDYSTSTQGLEETSTAIVVENFSSSSHIYESTHFTDPSSQPSDDATLNVFSDTEEFDSNHAGHLKGTVNDSDKDSISIEETQFSSNTENQYSSETSTVHKDDVYHPEESQFPNFHFGDESFQTEALNIDSNADTVSNENSNSEVPETPTPTINIGSTSNIQSNTEYLIYNNHKGKETELVSEDLNETANTDTNHVQIFFGQTSNELFTSKPEYEKSAFEAQTENYGKDSVETYFTIDGNKYGIALHEYGDLTSTGERALATDDSTTAVSNGEMEGQDPSFYDHEYDGEDITSEANINFPKSSIVYKAETPKYFDSITSEDPIITQETSYFHDSNKSSNLSSELSQTVKNPSNISNEKLEFSVESSTAAQDQFSVFGYLGELFSGINVYSPSSPSDPAITENTNTTIGISEIDNKNTSIETFSTIELNHELFSNVNPSIEIISTETLNTLIDKNEINSTTVSAEDEFQRKPNTEIYGNVTGLLEGVTEILSDKINDNVDNTQDALESAENQTVKIYNSFLNFSIAEDDVKNPDNLDYPGTTDSSLSISISTVKENKDSNDTNESFETSEYIPTKSENSSQRGSEKGGELNAANTQLLQYASEEQEENNLNVGGRNITEPLEIINEITYATSVASYVLSREKSTINIFDENSPSESSDIKEVSISNTSDNTLIDLDPKESVDVTLHNEDLNQHHEQGNHSVAVSVNNTHTNLTTEENKADNIQIQSFRPYSLFDVISNVFKAPGYDSEVHSSFLKEQIDYSEKKKPVTVVKRDTNQLEEQQISSIYEAAIPETKDSEAEPLHQLQTKKNVSSDGSFEFQPLIARVTSSFFIVRRRPEDISQTRWKIPIRNPVGDIQEMELPTSYTLPPRIKFPSRGMTKKEVHH